MSELSNQQADMQDMKHLIRLYKKPQKGCGFYTETRLLADDIQCYLKDPDNLEKQADLRGRLAFNGLAEQYRRALGLEKLPPFEEWDVRGFRKALPNLDSFARILTDAGLIPREVLGYSYRRPVQYLAAEMATAGYTEVDVYDAIESLQQHKEHAITNMSLVHSLRDSPNSHRTIQMECQYRCKGRTRITNQWTSRLEEQNGRLDL